MTLSLCLYISVPLSLPPGFVSLSCARSRPPFRPPRLHSHRIRLCPGLDGTTALSWQYINRNYQEAGETYSPELRTVTQLRSVRDPSCCQCVDCFSRVMTVGFTRTRVIVCRQRKRRRQRNCPRKALPHPARVYAAAVPSNCAWRPPHRLCLDRHVHGGIRPQ